MSFRSWLFVKIGVLLANLKLRSAFSEDTLLYLELVLGPVTKENQYYNIALFICNCCRYQNILHTNKRTLTGNVT